MKSLCLGDYLQSVESGRAHLSNRSHIALNPEYRNHKCQMCSYISLRTEIICREAHITKINIRFTWMLKESIKKKMHVRVRLLLVLIISH